MDTDLRNAARTVLSSLSGMNEAQRQENLNAFVELFGQQAYRQLLTDADLQGQELPRSDGPGLTRKSLLANKARYAAWCQEQREAGRDPTKELESLPRE